MAKVLLLSYGCEPNKGSEAGLGWHWAGELSKRHQVIVLTHPRGRAAIEAQLAIDPRPNLRIRYVQLPFMLDPWRRFPGEQAIQLRYIVWQLAAYLVARRIVAREEIDLVHHVSWTTMTGPTLGWALGKPFVWGPVGSGQRAPLQMRRFLGFKGWLREAIRNTQVATVTLNPLARLTARRASIAFGSNPDTVDRLRDLGASPIRLQPDVAADESWLAAGPPAIRRRERPIIAWSSRMMARKAPGLAIEAFARLRAVQDAELWMIGDGPLRTDLVALTRRLGVERDVKFWGWVEHDRVPELLSNADMFLFTSLRDTAPLPVIEAMARGLPVVALDLHGVANLTDESALKIPVNDPNRLVGDISDALLDLATSPDLRSRYSRAGWDSVRRDHIWPRRFAGIDGTYEMILNHEEPVRPWSDMHGCAAD